MLNAEAFIGLSEIKKANGDWAGAVEDLTMALKNCVPFQPVFWTTRRLKGEAHLALNQGKEAAFEFKFFTKRAFKDDDPNLPFKGRAWSMYVTALEKAGEKKEALEAAKQAKIMGYAIEKPDAPAASKPRLVAQPA